MAVGAGCGGRMRMCMHSFPLHPLHPHFYSSFSDNSSQCSVV